MNRSRLWSVDWVLLTPVIILVVLSLSTLFSINPVFFRNQLFFLLVSFLAFFFFSQVSSKIIQLYNVPFYALSIILLIVVLILGIESRGSIRWVEILGLRIQFSEILKPFLAVSLSAFLVNNKNFSLRFLLRTLVLTLPIAVLIALQPDLGNALIYVFVVILTLFYFGFPYRYFLFGVIFFVISTPVFWNLLHDYQKQRLITFLNPQSDPLNKSYNVIQSIIAVGSGMIVGKGLGQGTQAGLRFLPERHTDFIFAAMSEQLGLVGATILILAFAFLLYRIYIIFTNTNDGFCKIFSVVCFFLILVQFFMNVGMNIGILPVVGVTLPFVSYGGNSLLSNFIILGLLSSFSKETKSREVLEIK